MADDLYADVDYDGSGVARSAQSFGDIRPLGGPVAELADGSRIIILPKPGSYRSTTWYPLVDDVADLSKPLGPAGTPAAELLERLKQYSE